MRRAVLGAILLSLLPMRSLLACYCDQTILSDSEDTVQKAAKGSAVVVRGKVVNVRPATSGPSGGDVIATLEVEESWRGPKDGLIEVGTVDNNCRFDFESGEDYLVYAYADGNGNFTTICSRTRQAAKAAYDLEQLRRSPPPPAPTHRAAQINVH